MAIVDEIATRFPGIEGMRPAAQYNTLLSAGFIIEANGFDSALSFNLPQIRLRCLDDSQIQICQTIALHDWETFAGIGAVNSHILMTGHKTEISPGITG